LLTSSEFAAAADACRLGASAPSGRSLEPLSNVRPRGMAVLRYVVPARGASLQTEFGLQVQLPTFIPQQARDCRIVGRAQNYLTESGLDSDSCVIIRFSPSKFLRDKLRNLTPIPRPL
jgi:hypothetical protein